jgi:hypothetical protein
MKITCLFLEIPLGTIAFVIIKNMIYRCGKPRNACLWWLIEPILILFRIVLLGAYFYYIWYITALDWIKTCYHAVSYNWWQAKTDPFLTNVSLINAFFAWFFWIIFWILFLPVIVLLGTNCIVAICKSKLRSSLFKLICGGL